MKTGLTNQPFDLKDVKPGAYLLVIRNEEGHLRTSQLLKHYAVAASLTVE